MSTDITKIEINELKNKVKTEIQRRKISFTFTDVTMEDKNIQSKDIYEILSPLLEINDFLSNNTNKQGLQSIPEPKKINDYINKLSKDSTNTVSNSCRSMCTGFCFGSCTNNCTSTCGSSCSSKCYGGCGNTCSGTCTSNCSSCGYACSSCTGCTNCTSCTGCMGCSGCVERD